MRSLRSVVSNPNSMHEPSSRLHWPKWPCDSFHLLSSRSRRLLYSTNIEDIHMRLYVGCAPLVTRASTRKKKKRSTLPIIAAFGSSTLAASEGGTTCDAQATSFNIRVEICSCRSDNLGVRIFFVVQKRIPFLSRSHSAPEQVTCARLSYAGPRSDVPPKLSSREYCRHLFRAFHIQNASCIYRYRTHILAISVHNTSTVETVLGVSNYR